MKSIAVFLYALSACLGIFGYWGVFTRSGQKEYDEMAGLIPGIALLLAAVLLLIALILSLISFCKRRKSLRSE